MFKNKKNLLIVLLSIIVLLLIVFICIFITNKKEKIDFSNMSSYELIEAFQNNEYEFEISKFSHSNSTIYLTLENKKEGICIQRIYNIYIGNMMTFQNRSANNEMADLIDLTRNDTTGEQQQYKLFEKWLNYYNISKIQLSDFLDYYYKNNKNDIKILDIN